MRFGMHSETSQFPADTDRRSAQESPWKAAVNLLRPHQWTKNLFVFGGLFFSGRWQDGALLENAVLAVLAFCFAASAGYCFNDLRDARLDRLHAWKRRRPVAAGLISPPSAAAIGALLALVGLAAGFLASPRVAMIISAYFLVNLLYSYRLKDVVLIDVFCIAMGFMLRVFAGTWAIGIPPSHWLVLCTMLLSLFLGFSKRYAELVARHPPLEDKRPVLRRYSREFLQVLLGATLAATIMTYGLYTVSPRTLAIHGTDNLVYTLPLAIFGLLRYLYLVMRDGLGENTVADMLRDPQILGTALIFIASIAFVLYM